MAAGKIRNAFSIVETGTTTDNAGDVWNYRKYSNGEIDLWLNADEFTFSGGQEGPYNGMYRRRENRTLSILTEILWCTACGVNSCMFISGVFVTSSNTIAVHQQGVSNTTNRTSASIWIKGRWK